MTDKKTNSQRPSESPGKSAVEERHEKVGKSQTNEPWEQDAERRLGDFGGQGEAPRKVPAKSS